MIDLHVHSNCSDGSLTPEELAKQGCEAKLTAIALTDHDCTDGIERFVSACKDVELDPVPGVEISVETDHGGMHVLGYYINAGDAGLQSALGRVRMGRESRNRRIVERLEELGVPIKWDAVAEQAGGKVIGRPHIARALVAAKHIANVQAAFTEYLGRGKPAYVDRDRLSPAEGIETIRAAGGVAVLAHPSVLKLNPTALRRLVKELTGLGLGGIEVYYPEHRPDQVALYKKIAAEEGLVLTGGSDFHGAMNPDIKLGRGFGGLRVPDCLLGKLKARSGVAASTRTAA